MFISINREKVLSNVHHHSVSFLHKNAHLTTKSAFAFNKKTGNTFVINAKKLQ